MLQFLCNVLNFRDTPSELRDYQRNQFAKEIKGKQERYVRATAVVSMVDVSLSVVRLLPFLSTGLKVIAKHLPYPRKYPVVNVTRESAVNLT